MSALNNRVSKTRIQVHRVTKQKKIQKKKTVLMTKRKKMTARTTTTAMNKTMMKRVSLAQMRTKKKKMPHTTT